MNRSLIVCAIVLLPYWSVPMPSNADTPPGECSVIADLADASEVAEWAAVNDGVMGGRSSGGPAYADGALLFEGAINTNGGGFSSIRRDLPEGRLTGADGVLVRLKTDGRTYRFTLRTAARYRGRSIAYQADLPVQEAGVWSQVFVAFADFRPSVFGQRVPAPPVDPDTAWSIGFIIADGKDGPFSMQVQAIEACASVNLTS
jgi:NADH dehydrogenase [ubiquinone] 1 alpha subcomplex assembly factor 1